MLNLTARDDPRQSDPSTLASFTVLLCGSGFCRTLPSGSSGYAISGPTGTRCRTSTNRTPRGVLALEMLIFGDSTPVQGVRIGCVHRKRDLFIGAPRMLGLGWGPMSLVLAVC